MMSELKPCPFCGSTTDISFLENPESTWLRYGLGCRNCDFKFLVRSDSKEFLIKEIWNKRYERTGEWTNCDTVVDYLSVKSSYKCSECGYETGYGVKPSNYCPNCGLMMTRDI